MKRLFWDKTNDSFYLRNNPEWCSIVIDKNNKMTIEYKNSFKKIDFKVSDENAWSVGLVCGGEMTVFIEQIN